jgi:UDP-glucose 4-epimerase
MSILVTGGAGYIGSHVVRQLAERRERVVVLDNLSTGFRSAVLNATLVVGDTGDRELVTRLLREHGIKTVMHFAAHTIVPESVSNPLKYYGNNTCSTRSLLQACSEVGVEQFVFSSTAAVYGIPEGGVAAEDSPTQPINPYGTSKIMSEWMLRDSGAAMSRVAIRAGASGSRRSTARCSRKSRARPRSANALTCRSSAPTIRRRTVRACAITFTSKISRALT